MKKIKILIFGIVISILSSCSLEHLPYGNASGNQIWNTAGGIEQMVSGSYSLLRKVLINDRPMYLYGDLPSNAVLTHNHWIAKYAAQGDYVGAYLADWWLDWRPYYQIITTTATILKHIDDVPLVEFSRDETEALEKRNQLKGEAYFLYAYTYFYLSRIYGDVPLVKEAFESVSQGLENGTTIPRKQAPEKETLTYLLKHIDAAIVLMDYKKIGDNNWAVRVDKSAALTLKAHVLLWLAKDETSNSAEYIKLVSNAESTLDIVINQSGRSLVDYNNPKAVVDMFDGQSSEGIFELLVSVEKKETYHMNAGGFSLHTSTYRDVSRQTLSNLTDFLIPDPAKATNLYPQNDKRRNLFFQNFGNPAGDHLAPPFLLKYASNIEDDPSYPDKYYTNSNVLLFRLSDCVLLRAEALTKLGRYGNARMLLNTIRNRAGIGNYMGSDSNLIKEIFEERARELVGEGHSAYDRIRNNYWDGSEYMTDERKQKKGYYWPVDFRNLISSNPDLYQVPFWIGKL